MTITHVIVLLASGIGVGFASGLLGVGGAFIMTPVQYMIYVNMGIPADTAIKLAFGTGMMIILPTAISGTWRHRKEGAVWWKAAIIMGGTSLIGALSGSTVATHLPGALLKIVFGAIVLVGAIRMLTSRLPQIDEPPRENPWLWVAYALPAGFIAGLVGIGGGVLVVPLMTLALRFKMHTAIATSLAMIILTSLGGATGYIVNGIGVPGLPAYSVGAITMQLGYVYLQAWFLLMVTSIGMAQVGAMTAHRLPARQLRYVFIALMFYVALKMLGVFDWLGWPI